jgi:SAM-dependent methyltransferase
MRSTPYDLSTLKQTWASGNFGNIGARHTIVSELLCETADLHAGERVLDVATGAGNTAICAARRFCHTVGIDYVPALLEQARQRAAAEGLDVTFKEGDAAALPEPDASFDVVMSTFGVMFVPDHVAAAAELLRVCRSGGRIALANWVPDGAFGAIFGTIRNHVPPPDGFEPPAMWGTAAHLRTLFGDLPITVNRRSAMLRFPSPDFWVEYSARNFGPTLKAFEAVGPDGADALRADLIAAIGPFNAARDGTLKLRQDYVEVVIGKP